MTKKRRLKMVEGVKHFEEVRDVSEWSRVLLGDR